MEALYQDYGQNTGKVKVLSMDIGQSTNTAIDSWISTNGPANYPAIGGVNAYNYWGNNFYSTLGGSLGQLVVIIPNKNNPGTSTVDYSYAGGSLTSQKDQLVRSSLSTHGFYGVGINEYNAQNNTVQIYPNPAVDFINVNIEQFTGNEIIVDIYNILGEKVKSQTLNNETNTVDVSDLVDGYYMVKIQTEQETNIFKLQISK